MDSIAKIIKTLLAVAMVAALFVFGAFIFAVLLGIACLIAIILWIKRWDMFKTPDAHSYDVNPSYATKTSNMSANSPIIEGEAVEVHQQEKS